MNTKIKTLNGYEIVDEEARQRIQQLENVPPGSVDLTGYATEDWVTQQQYAKKSELPTVPTKVSELENDKGYLTEHQSLDGKADKEHTHLLKDITDYVAPVIPSLEGYATEQYVNDAIDNIELPTPDNVDLTGYYTKEEIDNKGYLTSIPTEYVTETELAGKGYLTEHQSLAGYATETYVTDAITTALNNIANAEDGSY